MAPHERKRSHDVCSLRMWHAYQMGDARRTIKRMSGGAPMGLGTRLMPLILVLATGGCSDADDELELRAAPETEGGPPPGVSDTIPEGKAPASVSDTIPDHVSDTAPASAGNPNDSSTST